MNRSRINPFIYSRAVEPKEFVGRETDLNHLGSRMATGQSTAVIGMPHVGKTSLLKYVMDAPTRRALWGAEFDHDVFRILDAHMLRSVKTQAEFWSWALEDFNEACTGAAPDHLVPILPVYQTARENGFGTFVLEQLFEACKNASVRFFLFLDEFDDLLSHPVLNSAEFYGSLRSLASRSLGLVLVLGSRRDVEQLNSLTQGINPHGSPYFNVFTQIILGKLSEKAFDKLIRRAGARFDQTDIDYIRDVSGLYPFLVQAAAAMLWDASEEGLAGYKRYAYAGRHLYNESRQHFADSWRVWSNAVRRAVTTITLAQIPGLLPGHQINIADTSRMLNDYTPELRMLEDLGLLANSENGWRVTMGAFLWWLADELKRSIRDDMDFNAWLAKNEMDGLFTGEQKEHLSRAASSMLLLLGKGAETLIETVAKGAADAVLKRTANP